MRTKQITLKTLREHAQSIGMKVTKLDGEYRVNFWDGDEASAYYTSDAMDARATAEAMSARRWPSHHGRGA